MEEFASPFIVKTLPVALSNRIASASSAAVVVPSTASVARSNIVTVLSPPLVMKPWPVP
jgi:hypothetical protein